MTARLTAFLPDRPAAVRWLTVEQELRIGRAPECELRLEHASVSRHHATLVRAGSHWRLRDLSSKNGSFVDGHPAIPEAELAAHSWLRFYERFWSERLDALERELSQPETTPKTRRKR